MARPDQQCQKVAGVALSVNTDVLGVATSCRVEIENGKVLYLEIAVNGTTHWNGSEVDWPIRDQLFPTTPHS